MKNRVKPASLQAPWLTDQNALYELSCQLDNLRFESPHESLAKTQTLLESFTATDYPEAEALLTVHIADNLRQLGRHDESAEACLRAVKKLEAFKSSFSFPRALNSLGSIEGVLGNTNDAIKHSLLALQLAESGGYSAIAARCCTTLSFLYCALHQYESAIEYCVRIRDEDCDVAMQTVKCINWSEALDHLDRYEEALDVIEHGLELVKNQPDRKFYSLLLNNKACLFVSIDREEEAAEVARLAETYFAEDGYRECLSMPSRDLGFRYMRFSNYPKAIQYLERSVSIAEEHDQQDLLPDLYEMLADAYMGANRVQEGYELLKTNLQSTKKKYALQVIASSENRAMEQLEWIRKEYDLLQEINTEMRRAKESVEESNRRKTELLANISHEIRTPMNGVIGLAKKLMTSQLDPDQLSTVRNISKCGENLVNIVDEILALTEIENGSFKIEKDEFDFRAFVSDIQMLFEPMCSEKGLQFSSHVDASIHSTVLGDASRIRQVVINFVGNAIKFTESGFISIRVTRTSDAVGSERARFSVTDTGAGLSQESLNAILHGESSRYSLNSRKFGGNGLGLTISRNIISALGGEFGIESELGVGSTFWFEIELPNISPQFPETTEAGNKEEDLIANKTLTGIRILVAEDNIINWMVIESLLAQLGASVSRASDGEEAVRLDSLSPFDVILMDCHMPKMSGYQASMLIREHERTTGARKLILALSADVMDTNKELCLECGMDGFLAKPISTSELVAQIQVFKRSTPV